ncbi:SDR family NAD(P)-dependent oxidoreductase [Neorhizobium sp. S3-V5DH]|uniref:SDR family NAD(P)-dependent oxidoreductase n=1 Tax=Neorhizobium sp. S3-V5DH TaxID=2485166 RepID=UPI00104914F7|nr:SDR family NAD(P)-dependent oxidoreductase [Neorhizobium sp. S3-V5DH]TCV68669.1 NAD(P)-dependent dehydrogenase (short-subunit alcohol dehydrogenase family) [Neorhizobium sp. S3-V5DH]
MEQAGRTAIVTGAGGGLGRCHALQLARLGARVVVNDLNEAAAKAVVEEIVAGGGEALAFEGSVTDEARVAVMVDEAMARFGRIDILVNNAGILRDKSFAKMTMADFRLVVEVHLMGAAICSKAVWEIMRAQQYGRIVMTTSSSGLYGNFGQANYGAAKMALVGLMQTLAIEGAKHNIRVNALAPTAATAMTEGLLSAEALALLGPEKVSPGLLALVGDEAPTRAILCAGAGHFATANVTLTAGCQVGSGPSVAQDVVNSWSRISERDGEIVPAYGFTQAERELRSAGYSDLLLAEDR